MPSIDTLWQYIYQYDSKGSKIVDSAWHRKPLIIGGWTRYHMLWCYSIIFNILVEGYFYDAPGAAPR